MKNRQDTRARVGTSISSPLSASRLSSCYQTGSFILYAFIHAHYHPDRRAYINRDEWATMSRRLIDDLTGVLGTRCDFQPPKKAEDNFVPTFSLLCAPLSTQDFVGFFLRNFLYRDKKRPISLQIIITKYIRREYFFFFFIHWEKNI